MKKVVVIVVIAILLLLFVIAMSLSLSLLLLLFALVLVLPSLPLFLVDFITHPFKLSCDPPLSAYLFYTAENDGKADTSIPVNIEGHIRNLGKIFALVENPTFDTGLLKMFFL